MTIPNSVTSIGKDAFYLCSSLTSVTLPSPLTTIGDYAFYGCTGIQAIHAEAKIPPMLGSCSFDDLSTNNVKLYVPFGTIGDYSCAKGWKDFQNIIEEDATAITTSEINDRNAIVEYFTLDGKKVSEPSVAGIYIVKKDGKSKKVVVKK